ncbi:MAG: Ig-like domain-containing protein, partial [Bacteroidia bacterium]|nr:Ig-like domain-containing protein [Bacteroidia bacterium]
MLWLSACKKDSDSPSNNNNNNSGKRYVLQIEQGARTIQLQQSLTYTARLVDQTGASQTATGVTWSSSNTDVATISASGTVTVRAEGNTTITASVSRDGATYTASVPLGVYTERVFTVAPAAIIAFPGEEIPLTPIMMSASGVNVGVGSFTYQVTTGSNVVSLINTSVVKANSPGYAEVKVTANTSNGNPFVIVPIQVVGVPDVPLPIVRITVKPTSANIEDVELFRGETQQFSATAYNSAGNTVNTSFTWSTLDPNIATVDQTGKVTAVNPGETKVQATAQGIIGTADVFVYPDTVVVVTPFYAMPSPGSTVSFSAKVFNARTGVQLTGVPLQWEMPQYPAPFEMFNIGSIQGSSTGSSVTVRINNNAIVGMMSFVAANVPGHPDATGIASIVVDQGGSSGGCGADNPAVHSIVIN